MEQLDVPILGKAYDLAKALYALRGSVPKQDRYALWQRCENLVLDVLESLLIASQFPRAEKLPALTRASMKLDVLRVCLRLAKDTKAISLGQYAQIQTIIDEIGRMTGGWTKSVRAEQPKPREPGRSFGVQRSECRTDDAQR